MQKTKKYLLSLIIIILVFLLIFEISVRLTWERPVRTYEKGLLIEDNITGFKLNPGFEGYILGHKGLDLTMPVKINNKGLRDDEVDYKKPENVTRIVVIGDTITFGTRNGGEEIYSSLIENQLKSEGYNVEVINLGVPAYEPKQEYLRYYQEGLKYDPDIVVMTLAMNDILYPNIEGYKRTFENHGDLYIEDAPLEGFVKAVCRSCTFVYSLYNNRHIGFTNRGYLRHVYGEWENETAFSEFSEEFSNFSASLKEKNIDFVVAMYPYIIQMDADENFSKMPQHKVGKLAASNNVDFIDVSLLINDKDYKKYFTSDGRIASFEGHKKIAMALKEELISIINQEHK